MICGFLSSLLWPAAGRLLSPPSGTCRRSDTQTPSWMWSLREWERCSAWPETQETNRQRRKPNRWWTAPNRHHWRTAAWSGTTWDLPVFFQLLSLGSKRLVKVIWIGTLKSYNNTNKLTDFSSNPVSCKLKWLFLSMESGGFDEGSPPLFTLCFQ